MSCDLLPSEAKGPHYQGIADAMAEQGGSQYWLTPPGSGQ